LALAGFAELALSWTVSLKTKECLNAIPGVLAADLFTIRTNTFSAISIALDKLHKAGLSCRYWEQDELLFHHF